MTLTNDTHDMSPPEHVPHGAPSSALAADLASIRKQARSMRAPSSKGRGPLANLISLAGRRKRYTKALEQLEEPIGEAVNAARVDGASWESIGHILGVHKDTARRTYQTSSVEAGGPEPRIKRCGMQHATAAGWCRNGVAGMIKRTTGGPGIAICRTHGEEAVASGKYMWHVRPAPLPADAQE